VTRPSRVKFTPCVSSSRRSAPPLPSSSRARLGPHPPLCLGVASLQLTVGAVQGPVMLAAAAGAQRRGSHAARWAGCWGRCGRRWRGLRRRCSGGWVGVRQQRWARIA